MKKCLVVGGSGFIGKNVLKILPKNIELIIITSKKSEILKILKLKNFKNVSIKNHSFIKSKNKKTLEKQDIIINCAGAYPQKKNQRKLVDLNYKIPKLLFDLSKNNKITHFINMNTFLKNKKSSYVKYKHNLSDYFKTQNSNTKVIDLHVSHLYGDIDNNKEFIFQVIKKILENKKNLKLSKGLQKRDFLHIIDFKKFVKKILSKKFTKSYNKFYVCNYKSYSIKEMILILRKITLSDIKLIFGYYDYKKGEEFSINYDHTEYDSINWGAKINLKRGLKLFFNEIKKNINYA